MAGENFIVLRSERDIFLVSGRYVPIPKVGERGFDGFIATLRDDRSNAIALVDQINKSTMNLLETLQWDAKEGGNMYYKALAPRWMCIQNFETRWKSIGSPFSSPRRNRVSTDCRCAPYTQHIYARALTHYIYSFARVSACKRDERWLRDDRCVWRRTVDEPEQKAVLSFHLFFSSFLFPCWFYGTRQRERELDR